MLRQKNIEKTEMLNNIYRQNINTGKSEQLLNNIL
jgi:hypothetical protein